MEPNRKHWNEQQQLLQHALSHSGEHQKAFEICLNQHAMVHAAQMSGSHLWSFEDEVLDSLTEADYRHIPPKGEHSIAWVIWHIARIEDVTMNSAGRGLFSGVMGGQLARTPQNHRL